MDVIMRITYIVHVKFCFVKNVMTLKVDLSKRMKIRDLIIITGSVEIIKSTLWLVIN